MENSKYIVSARKYRPKNFESVIGQQSLTTTLRNAIATGKLAHAYLFCGPRGVGKTTCARIFAKTINCLSPLPNGDACGQCESCKAFDEQRSFNISELDAASNNSVDDIRALIEQVQIPPQIGKYKVFIIDEVHMLSQAAFNAFLKTLEEPPAHAIFILATTEKHKILPTILSRCQIYDFKRMEVADIVGHLKHVAQNEGITFEDSALGVIAQKADGAMRDALSIFDQVASFSDGNITYKKVIEDLNVLDYEYYFKVTDSLLKHDVPALMLTLNEIIEKGFQPNLFVGGLASHFRDLLVCQFPQTANLMEVAENVKQRYQEQAARCKPKFLYAALKICNDCDMAYRESRNKRLLVELTLIEIAQLEDGDSPACGLGPTKIKQLKPIFAKAEPKPTTVAENQTNYSTARQPSSAKANTQQAATPSVHTAPEPPKQQAQALKTIHTISIRGNNTRHESPKAQQETKAQTTVVAKDENSPFGLEELNYQWFRFAQELPKEMSAAAGRMKNMKPEIVGQYAIDVPVPNSQVKEYMDSLATQLLAFLQRQLHNSHIKLTFTVVEPTTERRAYSRREQLMAMMEKSPQLKELAEALQLELA